MGIYPPLFGLIGYFKFWIGYFNFLYWVSIWKQISNETGPCFSWLFCLLSVSLSESTLAILVYLRSLFPTYFENPTYLSIHLWFFESTNGVLELVTAWYYSIALRLFRPCYAIVIVKRDECRNCANIGYS